MIELKDGVSFNDIFVREKCQEFFKASTSVNKRSGGSRCDEKFDR